jgi:PAS domain S-box-containing protein
MKGYLNSLSARLLTGSGIPLVLFIGVALVSSIVIHRLFGALLQEKHSHEVLTQALLQQQKLEVMRLAVLEEAIGDGLTFSKNYPAARAEFQRHGDRLLELVQDNPHQSEQARNIQRLEDEWHHFLQDNQSRMPAAGEQAVVEANRRGPPLAVQSDMRAERLGKEIDTFIDTEERLLADRSAETALQTRQSIIAIAGAAALALLVTVYLSLQSARGVTWPIKQLGEAARQLMAGRVQTVPPAGPTEIGDLIVHFNHMALTLSERVSALQGQEERYRTYIGAIAHILWTTNAGGEVAGDLPTWRAFTGQTVEALQGMGWLDAIHPEDRARVEQAWRQAVNNRSLFEAEYRLRAESGDYRPFSCRGVPIIRADRTVREWIGTCTDISEHKNEVELRRAKETAEAMNRAKSEFLTKMSHELRTPLNAVIGMSKMLATQRFGPLTAKQADYLKDIAQAGEHLLLLINDILDLSRVEAGRMDVQAESFALTEVVRGLLSTLRPLAEAKGITLCFEAPAADGPLNTDPARFRQILYNLLSNGIKFTPGPGTVTVHGEWIEEPELAAAGVAVDQARGVRVTVQDTGIGIAPEDQAAVWDEFRQLKRGVADGQGGTGLGLALTRRLVQLLGGGIELRSVVGQGSVFTVVLPRQLPQPPAAEEGARAESSCRPLALVIEDHVPTNKLLADWLREAGLSAVSAYDGATGLDDARRLRPRLIVLDLRLPRLDGWQLLTELKNDPETAGIPAVIVTVSEDRNPAHPEVREFFVKPVERDDFLKRLQRVVPEAFSAD